MLKIVQLCGRAPDTQTVPADIGAERWIIGSAFDQHIGTAYTRVFDVHDFAYILEKRPEAWLWYAEQDKPVYLLSEALEIPNSLPYPRELLRVFGSRGYTALSSSVDHMMALALVEGFEEIHLCGVRMASAEEWITQRECLAYWIGRAESMGVTVITDPLSALCTPERVYGFNEDTGVKRAPGSPVIVYGIPGSAAA